MVEFDLYSKNKKVGTKVVCISDKRWTVDAIEVPEGSPMPPTWREGYEWMDLNIMRETYMENGMPNLVRLRKFLSAFQPTRGGPLFIHVWESRLPTQTK